MAECASAFKALEDRTDAVFCAYVAALAWLGRVEALGTLSDGYIVLPRTPALAASRQLPRGWRADAAPRRTSCPPPRGLFLRISGT